MNSELLKFVGNCFLFVFMLGLIFLYLKNIYKLINDVSRESYSLITAIRGVGVFMIPLGIVMGFV